MAEIKASFYPGRRLRAAQPTAFGGYQVAGTLDPNDPRELWRQGEYWKNRDPRDFNRDPLGIGMIGAGQRQRRAYEAQQPALPAPSPLVVGQPIERPLGGVHTLGTTGGARTVARGDEGAFPEQGDINRISGFSNVLADPAWEGLKQAMFVRTGSVEAGSPERNLGYERAGPAVSQAALVPGQYLTLSSRTSTKQTPSGAWASTGRARRPAPTPTPSNAAKRALGGLRKAR